MSLFCSPRLKCLIMSSFTLIITPLQVRSGFSDALGYVLLMGAQANGVEAQMLRQFTAMAA